MRPSAVPRNPFKSVPWDVGLGREVGTVFWAMFFLEGAFGAYMGVWPLWIERLGAPVTVVGLVLGSSGLLRLVALGPSAALAERLGARRLILAARVSAGVGLLSAALASHWSHLLIMVALSAFGELAFPLVQSHVAARAHGSPVRSFSLVFTVGPSVALGISPLVAGGLIAAWGLRAAFVFAAVLTALSVACFARLREVAPRGTAATDGGASYRTAVANGVVRRLLILQAVAIFSLALGTSLAPNFLAEVRGFSPAAIAQMGAGAAVGSAAFGLIISRVGRLQRAPFISAALAVAAVGVAFLIFLTTAAPVLLAVAWVGRGGLFATWALFSAALGAAAPARIRSRAFALSEMGAGTAFSLAPIVAGPLYAIRPAAPMAVAAVLSAILVPTLLLAQVAARKAPVAPDESDLAAAAALPAPSGDSALAGDLAGH